MTILEFIIALYLITGLVKVFVLCERIIKIRKKLEIPTKECSTAEFILSLIGFAVGLVSMALVHPLIPIDEETITKNINKNNNKNHGH